MRCSHILGKELHLLRHAALHDGVVPVEAHGQPFAVEHLLANEAFYESTKLFRSWLAMPLGDERDIKLRQVVEGEDDLMIHVAGLASIHQAIHRKQGETN